MRKIRKKLHLFAALLIFMCSTAFSQQGSLTASYPFGNCPPAQVDFNISPAIGANYYWYFSDGGSYNTTTPYTSYTFNNPGYNYASVSIYDANGYYITNTYVYVDLAGATNIYMTPYDKKVCPGDPIELYVPYNGSGATFSWDFGDTQTQTGSSNGVMHEYSSVGDYTVTCTVTFSGCPSTLLTDTVHVQSGLPVSSGQGGTGGLYFSLSPDSACIGDDIIATFQNNIYSHYFIDFGDGYTSSNSNSHPYQFNGLYHASLTVTNGCGNSATQYDSIVVASGLGISNPPYFFPSNYNNCPNTSVSFYAGGFASYSWTLGNGNTSTVSNPTTTYSTPGVYPVTLQVMNGCGATSSRTDSIYIVNNMPVGAVSLNMADTVCPGTPLLVEVYANGSTNYSVNYAPGSTINTPNNGLFIDSHNGGGGGGSSSASGEIGYETSGTYTV